jgi:hypothetical protein
MISIPKGFEAGNKPNELIRVVTPEDMRTKCIPGVHIKIMKNLPADMMLFNCNGEIITIRNIGSKQD